MNSNLPPERLLYIATFLFELLDDISARLDDAADISRRRFEVASTNGYDILFKPTVCMLQCRVDGGSCPRRCVCQNKNQAKCPYGFSREAKPEGGYIILHENYGIVADFPPPKGTLWSSE